MTLDDLRKIAEKMGSDKWVTVGGVVAMQVNECTCFGGDPVLGHEPLCGIIGIVEGIPEQLAKFIATFNPKRVLELLDRIEMLEREHGEMTEVIEPQNEHIRELTKATYVQHARLAAVEKIADAIEEHDAPFEAFPAAQWIRKVARGE